MNPARCKGAAREAAIRSLGPSKVHTYLDFDGWENVAGKICWILMPVKIVIDFNGRKRVHSLLACK